MTEQNKESTGDINEELRNLGKNIEDLFRSAWDSEERVRLQQDIANGLRQAGDSLKQAADDIASSETGQKIKAEAQDIHERWESGEIQSKMKTDVYTVLRRINTELELAANRMRRPNPEENAGNNPYPGDVNGG